MGAGRAGSFYRYETISENQCRGQCRRRAGRRPAQGRDGRGRRRRRDASGRHRPGAQVRPARHRRGRKRREIRLSDRPRHGGYSAGRVDSLPQPENQPPRRPRIHLCPEGLRRGVSPARREGDGLPAQERCDGHPQRAVDRAFGGVRQRAGAGHRGAREARVRLLAPRRCAGLHPQLRLFAAGRRPCQHAEGAGGAGEAPQCGRRAGAGPRVREQPGVGPEGGDRRVGRRAGEIPDRPGGRGRNRGRIRNLPRAGRKDEKR